MLIFVRNIVLFALFSAVFYMISLVIAGEILPSIATKNLKHSVGQSGQMYTRLQEADTVKNVDILVLGSSHAYRGYDPRIFSNAGYKTFVLGSSAQSFLQTEWLMDRYLKSLNPKLVVFDVYPALFDSDGVESSLDLLSSTQPNVELLKMIHKQNHIILYNTFIYSLYKEWFSNKSRNSETILGEGDAYISGGYIENFTSTINSEVIEENEIIFDRLQIDAFNNILLELKDRRIPTLLIQAPTTQEKDASFINMDSVDMFLSTKAEYFNFNNILSLDHSCFKDHSHLNQKGVNVFNRELIAIIERSQCCKSLWGAGQ